MKRDLIIPGVNKATIIQVKNNLVVPNNSTVMSNLLQLELIEKYQRQHPSISIENAARIWIRNNASHWRKRHSLTVERGLL